MAETILFTAGSHLEGRTSLFQIVSPIASFSSHKHFLCFKSTNYLLVRFPMIGYFNFVQLALA